MAREPNDYALLVGIQEYPDHTNLKGPHGDVADFAAWLTNDMHGGGLDATHVVSILSDGTKRLPNHDEVDVKLNDVLVSAQQNGGRRLYVYFSGHGIAGSASQALLCLASWSLRTGRVNAALDELHYLRSLQTWGAFSEVVFLADCCRSWVHGVNGLPFQFAKVPPQSAVRELRGYGTRDKYPSFEAGGEVVRGHFTRALLEGLYGAAGDDRDRVPGVTASALKSYVESRTTEIARTFKQDQEAEVALGLRNEAVFGLAPARGDVVITGPPMQGEELVVVGPAGSEIARRPAAPGEWHLNVNRGLHVVETVGGRILRSFRPLSTVKETHVEL